ncbi:MAG: hypothetical protein HQL61_11685 [Magnetococcales bacterium]|uniref:Secreted protein n=1 Tax=Candidatus Magnetobacterium casense TaxID=1455061 RepID=A0ABS6S2U6_9BACT|nr:hypothetical protein [Candidatus Magnetobacterium casensis]MBF0608195.1 hypothetical protein [Nitrospirota bacterium]MBV6342738.1 hypothetical protein [Candidatus Magnetobacterium casensis]
MVAYEYLSAIMINSTSIVTLMVSHVLITKERLTFSKTEPSFSDNNACEFSAAAVTNDFTGVAIVQKLLNTLCYRYSVPFLIQ